MYKQDLALINPQGLICHKTQPTKHPNGSVTLIYSFICKVISNKK